mgnify:CR=1 FL=1
MFAVFFRFDLYSYEWQNGQEFVKNPYFSTNEVSFNFDGISKINRKCRITVGKDGEIKSHFEYWVIGPDKTKFDLGHEPWKRVYPIDDYARKKPSLYSEPVEILLAPVLPKEQKSMETCTTHLKHEYDSMTAILLSKIYNFDVSEIREVQLQSVVNLP